MRSIKTVIREYGLKVYRAGNVWSCNNFAATDQSYQGRSRREAVNKWLLLADKKPLNDIIAKHGLTLEYNDKWGCTGRIGFGEYTLFAETQWESVQMWLKWQFMYGAKTYDPRQDVSSREETEKAPQVS